MDDKTLKALLARVGAEVVKSTRTDKRVTILCRVRPASPDRWPDFLEKILLLFHEKRNRCSLDMSQTYFVSDDGSVRYLWRMIITVVGEDDTLEDALAWLKSGAAEHSRVEITSMPLVGRKQYPFDPAQGITKGAHDTTMPARVISGAGR